MTNSHDNLVFIFDENFLCFSYVLLGTKDKSETQSVSSDSKQFSPP